MPELPDAKMARFLRDYGLTPYDAGVLTATRALADYFEAAVDAGAPAKAAASWISVELLRRLNDAGKTYRRLPRAPAALAELLSQSRKRRNHRRQRQESFRDDVRYRQARRGNHRRRRPGANHGYRARSRKSRGRWSRKARTTWRNIAPETKAYSSFLSDK